MKSNQIITVAAIVGVVAMLACLTQWDYMWDGEFLGKWASAINIISLGAGIPIYLLKKRQDREDEKKYISRNLHAELKDALDCLDYEKYKECNCRIEFDENTATGKNKTKVISFINRNFNHDIYDSLIGSGKINFLDCELQQKIQDIFKRIKEHNYYLKYTNKLDDATDAKYIPFFKWMEDSENELLRTIPDILKRLTKILI